ncbi:MAG TPA: DUF4035 domain-containing protein [Candidatus Acidoferrales bacterium]|nr:DUF4035 domain-containing protein [Candidatus Acidoferrales bacterium]
MTVNELLSRCSSSELSDWEDYWREEPFGPRHEDYRIAILGAKLFNLNRGKNPAQSEADFIPRYRDQFQGSVEADLARIQGFIAAGAKVVRRKRGQRR